VLEQHLRREEALVPGAEPVRTFTAGKGDKAKEYPVYLREDVATCKTVESWHKEGRAIKEGEQPMKHVPMRAVTIVRKREMEDALRETGEKLQQGLYAIDQTDWIIPPPLVNGVIPKNAYGNMDVYVPTMVPKGAVHLPLKGSAKLCKRLQIDFAEACTGFEFGKQRAVPVLTGVVVAKENEGIVRDAWRVEQAEQKRKEDTKRTALALQWWRKMLFGLRIVQRMERDYADAGGEGEEINPFVNKAVREGRHKAAHDDTPADEEMAGGFFRPGHEEEEVPQNSYYKRADHGGGGFFAEGEEPDETDHDHGGGGFLVEEGGDDQGGGFIAEDAEEHTEPPSCQTSQKTCSG
jgi:xeroderma pigmentosum group C-complementing protein